MNFEVRKILESDIEGFHSALNSVVAEGKFLLTASPLPVEQVAQFVSDNIARDDAQFVAVIDEKVVGWADIIPHRKELIRHAGLLGMGVVSECRGNGIGTELLSRTVAHAHAAGLKRLELEVFANNTVAIALYEKSGFEHEGVKRKARYVNGCYLDVCIMSICYE